MPPAAADQMFAALAASKDLAVEVDGLSIEAGTFRQRDLVPGWIVLGGVELRPRGLVLTWLAVVPDGTIPDLEVTSRVLRLNHAQILDRIRRRLAQVDDLTRSAKEAVTGRPARWQAPAERRQPGPPRRTDDPRTQQRLRRIALAYLELDGPGVYRRLMARFRIKDEQQIKALVRAARADGWLAGASQQGRRGAMPGPRLEEERMRGDAVDHQED